MQFVFTHRPAISHRESKIQVHMLSEMILFKLITDCLKSMVYSLGCCDFAMTIVLQYFRLATKVLILNAYGQV